MTSNEGRVDLEKAELVITALQERIGEIVASYETQIALYRADMTVMNNELKAIKESLSKRESKSV